MKRIYIEIQSFLHRTQQDVAGEHYIYDFNEKKLKKYNCSKIAYKYNFNSRKMDIVEQNFKTVKYLPKSNIDKIQDVIGSFSNVSIVEDQSTAFQVVADVAENILEEFLDELQRNNITYSE